ncbi:hypothetical protein CFBP6600_22470 [Xanthomonas arboricola pv. corylina]|uniref:DUF3742 domain-containing protein n=3 Tax=Xanthomonas TaxID=338 RepID=A0ABM8RWK6_9XANT|nr:MULTISPECIES: DUF3742 family protein [Xanthomonas]KAB0523158.1 DUF3742 family protein [Xanthomonas cissicola]OOW60113.1 hypothetical protein Xant_10245 [Xanthomonas cissicola]CAE6775313.1 hypothetical protein CFBP6600_22470 [Xanthomonas arboricola pv. corylina]CAE6775335.1 hypothetical protein CFBP6600_22470 [Xanthomonas arboricola pv. corylina]CAE6775488.1 hypothetical protein XAC301_22630 [Xanthomonas arboricola pv. corylina]
MNTTTRISTAERLGRSVGRGWRAYARGERRLSSWLASKGVPVVGAALALWVVKLAVLGLLLYVAFWFAVVVLGVMVAGWAMDQQHPAEDDYELQYPTIEELRTTPGYDPNLHNDTSHEMYQDD